MTSIKKQRLVLIAHERDTLLQLVVVRERRRDVVEALVKRERRGAEADHCNGEEHQPEEYVSNHGLPHLHQRSDLGQQRSHLKPSAKPESHQRECKQLLHDKNPLAHKQQREGHKCEQERCEHQQIESIETPERERN